MTDFKWEGQTSGGQSIRGTMPAPSKEEAERRLKEIGVTIVRLESGKSDPPAVVDYTERLEPKKKPRRDLLWLVGVVIVLGSIGAAVAYYAPIVSIRCDRSAGAVSCSAVGSIGGVIPLWTRRLSDVVAVRRTTADIDPDTLRTERERLATIRRYETITFVNRRDESMMLPEAGGTFGDTSIDLENRFARFLGDETEVSASGWQGQWVPLIALTSFLFVAGLLMVAVVTSLIFPARVEAASLSLTRKARTRRRRT